MQPFAIVPFDYKETQEETHKGQKVMAQFENSVLLINHREHEHMSITERGSKFAFFAPLHLYLPMDIRVVAYEAEDGLDPKPENKKDEQKDEKTDPVAVESQFLSDRIKLLPKVGENTIPDNTPLARLQNPSENSPDWKKVSVSNKFRCKLRVQKSGQSYKSTKVFPSDGSEGSCIALNICLVSSGQGPKLRVAMELTRKKNMQNAEGYQKPVHQGSLDFSMGRVYKDENDNSVAPNQVSNLTTRYKPEHDNALISFETDGATANNLKCLVEFDHHDRVRNFCPRKEELDIARTLCSITKIPAGDKWQVYITVRPGKDEKAKHASGEDNAIDEFLAMLPAKDNSSESVKQPMKVPPYNQFRNASHEPRVQHGRMPDAASLYDQHNPGLPMPAIYAYRDNDEAAIIHSNSLHVQHLESSLILKSLEDDIQIVRLFTVGNMVFAAIVFPKPLTAGLDVAERITFPNGTIIDLKIFDVTNRLAVNDVKPHTASGTVVTNVSRMPCDVLVAVGGKTAADFVGLTSSLAEKARPLLTTLASSISDISCAAMINAIRLTYARNSKVTQKWCALTNDGGMLDNTPLINFTKCPQSAFQAAFNELMNPVASAGFKKTTSWNKKQMQHIHDFLGARGGMALLTGSSGSGKTKVMVHLMRFCLKVGINVLCLGMKHATLDLIVTKFEEEFPNEEKPLRAYSQSSESLTTEQTTFEATEKEELILLDIVRAELAGLEQTRAPLLLKNSIQHRVLENSKRKDMPAMVAKIPTGSASGEPQYADDTEYDYRQVFKDGLAARDEHPLTDNVFWNKRELKKFKYVYAALRAEVIQNSHLLFSTMINVCSKEISQNFSSATNIARFDDEAQTASEPASLVATSICQFSDNIIRWAMYGDIKQSGVINITGRGTENTVDPFHKQADVSLFLRLYMSGHEVVRLDTQWRQHILLFMMLNELHYHMSIRTVGAMKNALNKYTDLMGRIAGRSQDEIDQQSEAQKRMLCVELDSICMRAKDSRSRANPGNAAYVIRVVFPQLRIAFGKNMRKMVILLTPYAKQKELYGRWYWQLRKEGWIDVELPEIMTVDVSHGHEAHMTIVDVVNDNYEGFLKDPSRMLVMMSRARHQLLMVCGEMANVDVEVKKKLYTDVTNGNKVKQLDVQRPILHWKNYMNNNKCTHETKAPDHDIPSDLTPWRVV
ncbi:hypothetical protein E4T39_04879 [Aureobasidium subglaciale]|nr:hypothetical protein E4T39_04879 [Aureobasidium subglaciale]